MKNTTPLLFDFIPKIHGQLKVIIYNVRSRTNNLDLGVKCIEHFFEHDSFTLTYTDGTNVSLEAKTLPEAKIAALNAIINYTLIREVKK